MKIIYAGTPDFSVPALKALIESEHEVVAVYTQPDRPAGRGRKLAMSPVKQLALQHDIMVEQPLNFKEQDTREHLKAFHADIMVVAAYGLILPQAVLDGFPLGCINIHASLLPHWRGAAPIQRAIIAGDKKTGICIMQMEKGLDTGPYYHVSECDIFPTDTGAILHDRLMSLGAEALMQTLPDIFSGKSKAVIQDNVKTSYAQKLEKAEARINWSESAELIQRKIRAFNAWPVAFCELNGERIRIWEAEFDLNSSDEKPGTLINISKKALSVSCGQGVLHIQSLQFPGGKALPTAQILNAKKDILKIGVAFS